jgi:hypothetical protein
LRIRGLPALRVRRPKTVIAAPGGAAGLPDGWFHAGFAERQGARRATAQPHLRGLFRIRFEIERRAWMQPVDDHARRCNQNELPTRPAVWNARKALRDHCVLCVKPLRSPGQRQSLGAAPPSAGAGLPNGWFHAGFAERQGARTVTAQPHLRGLFRIRLEFERRAWIQPVAHHARCCKIKMDSQLGRAVWKARKALRAHCVLCVKHSVRPGQRQGRRDAEIRDQTGRLKLAESPPRPCLSANPA